jgi:hypothetical protein
MNLVTWLGLWPSHGLIQKPVVLPLSILHWQVPPQDMVALQLPGQKLANLVFVLSCKAETVPAESMVARMAANNVVLAIFLTMCIRAPFS